MTKKDKKKECCGTCADKNVYYILAGLVVLTILNTYTMFSLNSKLGSLMSGNLVLAGSDNEGTEPSDNQPSGNQPQEPPKVQVSVDDDPVKGSKDAPVTIIEFSDFECPFCARFSTQTLPSIQKDYIDTGKVKIVFRDFPLSFHQNAQKAAEASECADEQGKFWEYHDKLFENANKLDTASLKKYAEDLGLDASKFSDCLDSGRMKLEVQKDLREGQSYGVSGTPAFFVNGVKIVGAQPYSVFKEAIEQELNK